jgi:hypothetical protein
LANVFSRAPLRRLWGPLAEAVNERGTITCSFCGMVNEVSSSAPQPIVIKLDAGRHVARAGKSIAVVILVAVAFMLIGVGVITYQAMRPATGAIDIVRREALRARAAMRPLSLTDLPTLNERGHRQLNVAPPPGGWKTFDPVAGVPWASEIALAWAPDARLTRIDLTARHNRRCWPH